MFLNPALGVALDRITERAADVRRAFVPGAIPKYDDVASTSRAPEFTLDPLSVALPSDVYVACRNDAGSVVYTRNSSFTVAGGRLCTETGIPVLGIYGNEHSLDELHVDAVDAALGRTSDLRIEADGALRYARSVVDPRTGSREQQQITVGRIAVARFPAATSLPTVDGTIFSAPDGVAPHIGAPGDNGLPQVTPMRRQPSGALLDESLARLKAAYVAFDALAAAETAKGRFGKTATDLVK
jgi:flagellar basal body rod protein FlgG